MKSQIFFPSVGFSMQGCGPVSEVFPARTPGESCREHKTSGILSYKHHRREHMVRWREIFLVVRETGVNYFTTLKLSFLTSRVMITKSLSYARSCILGPGLVMQCARHIGFPSSFLQCPWPLTGLHSAYYSHLLNCRVPQGQRLFLICFSSPVITLVPGRNLEAL